MQNSSEIIIIDTGFIVALFNEKDEHHPLVKNIAERIDRYQWYTTSFVIQEIFWLLSKRVNRSLALNFFEAIQGLLLLPELSSDWPQKILKILSQYSSANIDIADASLVILADQLKTGKIVSVDRKDFSILRWNSGKNLFSNLLYE